MPKPEMASFGKGNESIEKKIFVEKPPTESLLYINESDSPWPSRIRENTELQEQATDRRELLKQINAVFSSVPQIEMDVSSAVDAGLLEPDVLAETYERFVAMLESDPESARILLYFPFEMLPPASWHPESSRLQEAAANFIKSYLHHWHSLLGIYDVRANFVDGDIPEQELRTGPLPRVSKAAHLIPKLVEKGIISREEVEKIKESDTNPILHESIDDALAVLADMEIDPTKKSESLLEESAISLDSLVESFAHDLDQLHRANKSPEKSALPEARRVWQQEQSEQSVLNKYASILSRKITDGSMSSSTLSDYIETHNAPDEFALLTINAIRLAVETTARKNVSAAKTLGRDYAAVLENMSDNNALGVHDALTSAWSHLIAVGAADENVLKKRGTEHPSLDARFAGNERVVQKEVRDLIPHVQAIESDPALGSFIYPVVTIFGSRLKGYSTDDADLDIAVFVKPNTPHNKQTELRELLAERFADHHIKGKPVEFWLEETESGLSVIDMPNPDMTTADSTWLHILFGAAWCGKEETIKMLHERLLPQYLHTKERGGEGARSIWLEEMEREALQYRLMHKGYARHYPVHSGMQSEHADRIDGSSAFWDSGYRRLATKLFLSRVFLPKLASPASLK